MRAGARFARIITAAFACSDQRILLPDDVAVEVETAGTFQLIPEAVHPTNRDYDDWNATWSRGRRQVLP